MSPRPRKASDQQVFAAAQRVMLRLRPGEVTLAEIAAEAGITAGALVQRFGGKHRLLVALTAAAAAEVPAQFARLRAAAPGGSPLAAVRGYGDDMATMGRTPALLAHHLAWLQLDITDPDMRRNATAQARAVSRALTTLLDEAVAARELPAGTNTRRLARAVQVTVAGSLMLWALDPQGPAPRAIRADLAALLESVTAGKKE
jgi:AcrR family transcriptional regulator